MARNVSLSPSAHRLLPSEHTRASTRFLDEKSSSVKNRFFFALTTVIFRCTMPMDLRPALSE